MLFTQYPLTIALSITVTAGSPQRSKKHRVQWNPVILTILSWREKEEEKPKERKIKEKTKKQPIYQAS